MNTWVAFDTETTGIEPGSRLLDLAGIAFDDSGRVISTFDQLVNPGMPVPADASSVHGLTDRMLAEQPAAKKALTDFLAWLPARSTLIAHNAPYDCDILTWEIQNAGLPLPTQTVMDTCRMAKTLAETTDNKLQTLIRHHRLSRAGNAHRAMPDADAVRQYFVYARTRMTPISNVWSARCSCPKSLPDSLCDLPLWIAAAASVRVGYTDKNGSLSERTLTPYGYAMTGSGLMVHGRCHTVNERRTFSAERLVVLDARGGVKLPAVPKSVRKSLPKQQKKVSRR